MSKIAIIGGGVFGLYLAYYLGQHKHSVDLFEKEESLMTRASYHNQARIHNGYHYPRSVLTALRSRISFPRFINDFKKCVCDDFVKYYCIGKPLSKVTAKQFLKFCLRIGAPIEEDTLFFKQYINPHFVEACFHVQEFAFDPIILRNCILEKIDNKYVHIHTGFTIDHIKLNDKNALELYSEMENSIKKEVIGTYDHVFNCTYSHLNYVIKNSQLSILPLKHEMTEMCLVHVPEEFYKAGVTIMCGPFFSIMPFPAYRVNGKYLHSLSHVRYTPHYEWTDKEGSPYIDAYQRFQTDQKFSAFPLMLRDASRYIPLLSECSYENSLWEVKTVLPRSETDDSRPILCRFNYSIKGFHCILGGKVDNIYDAVNAVSQELGV